MPVTDDIPPHNPHHVVEGELIAFVCTEPKPTVLEFGIPGKWWANTRLPFEYGCLAGATSMDLKFDTACELGEQHRLAVSLDPELMVHPKHQMVRSQLTWGFQRNPRAQISNGAQTVKAHTTNKTVVFCLAEPLRTGWHQCAIRLDQVSSAGHLTVGAAASSWQQQDTCELLGRADGSIGMAASQGSGIGGLYSSIFLNGKCEDLFPTLICNGGIVVMQFDFEDEANRTIRFLWYEGSVDEFAADAAKEIYCFTIASSESLWLPAVCFYDDVALQSSLTLVPSLCNSRFGQHAGQTVAGFQQRVEGDTG